MRASKEPKIIEVDAEVLFETEKAYKLDDGKRDKDGKVIGCWVPKSQCQKDDDGTIQMPEWLALDKGLI